MDSEKAFEKMWHLLKIQALKKLEVERLVLNIIKVIYGKPISNITGEKLKAFLLKSGTR
jgi:hypothetical protein